ncbi:MAG: GTP 3',8-cyclase MoaA [Bacteroidota bacterium]
MLLDNHNRPLNYMRLAVTDRCNLRCFYCMPEEGIKYLPQKELLTFDEILRIVSLTARMGISKIRLTGGEPFVRPDLMELIRAIVKVNGVHELHITTNGILTAPHIGELKDLGIKSVNLSLDTLNAERFKAITRRDEFEKTWATLQQLLNSNIPVKINAVVMEHKNIDDIVPMIGLTKDQDVSIRFIEEMPFNGEGNHYPKLTWTHKKILDYIKERFEVVKLPDAPNATAATYKVPGHKGTIGIIAAFSRTFCGTCNRIRVTAQGTLKTCLYDDGVLNLKELIRSGEGDSTIESLLMKAFGSREKNGFDAEKKRTKQVSESMSTIGG